jgi:hypothetical protein
MSTDGSRRFYGINIEGIGNKDNMRSTIAQYLTAADFSILMIGLATYFSFPAANNFFGFGMGQNQLLHASSILLFTCFAAAILGSILHFAQACNEYNKIFKNDKFKEHRKRFWATVGLSTFVLQLGLSLVAAVAFQQAIMCMGDMNAASHSASLYHFNSLITTITLLIGSVALVICLPDILTSIKKMPQCVSRFLPEKANKGKLKFLLPIAFVTYAFAGFGAIASHYDPLLCFMVGFLAISLGMFFCDVFHIVNVSRIKSNAKIIPDNQAKDKAISVDSIFFLTAISSGLLTAAIVLYVQNPVFLYTSGTPHFTTAFDLFLIGAGMLAIGLMWQSIKGDKNSNRYADLNEASAPVLNESS